MDVSFPKSIRGLTLIELILVMIVTSVLAVVVLVKWPGAEMSLAAQAEQLANDIRYTQALAMTKGQRFYLIQASSTTYQIKDSAGTAVKFATGNTTVTLNAGTTFGTLTNLPNSLVTFDGKGTPYTDTTSPGTALATAATIPLTANGQTESVVISPETGRVIIQ